MSLKSRIMRRCFDLARLGAGAASPNPIVGAVLVYEDRIIGEGFYSEDGGPHAEVKAVASVKPVDRDLISLSTLYVSLEPCNIYGRTPPCTNLILDNRIPHVIVAARDLTPGVNGSGLERLRVNGVKVEEAVLPEIGARLSRYRNVYVSENRPYIVLKYAQTENGYIAPEPAQSYWLTNTYSKRLVHKWRTTTDGILVGTGTARTDNPALSSRYFKGRQPVRLVIDRHNTLAEDLKLFDGSQPTWVLTEKLKGKHEQEVQINFQVDDWPQKMLRELAKRKIAHLTIEGGAWLLGVLVQHRLWDEARVFTTKANWSAGKVAPSLGISASKEFQLQEDTLRIYYNQ